jgi:L-aminopeptidase/D-esterase-like protein
MRHKPLGFRARTWKYLYTMIDGKRMICLSTTTEEGREMMRKRDDGLDLVVIIVAVIVTTAFAFKLFLSFGG